MRGDMIKFPRKFFTVLTLWVLMACVSEAQAVEFQAGGLRFKKPVKTFSELKRKDVVFQSLDFSCGAAGISTLFNYYLDKQTTESTVLNALFQITPMEKVAERKGFSLLDLKKLAQAAGYTANGYKMDMDFLRGATGPVLVPIEFRKYKHFVIVKAVIADRVFIADPATGNMSMKVDQFQQIWASGIGLTIEDPKRPGFINEAMMVQEKDFLVADYKRVQRLLDGAFVRAAIYPSEF